MLHDLQGLGSLTTIWCPFSEAGDSYLSIVSLEETLTVFNPIVLSSFLPLLLPKHGLLLGRGPVWDSRCPELGTLRIVA